MLYSLNKRNTLKQSQFIYIAPFKHLLYKIKLKPKINEVIKAEIIRVVVTATTIKRTKIKNIIIFLGTAICLV